MCIPNLFKKEKISKKMPEELEKEIKKLKKTKTKLACLKKAYHFMANTFGKYCKEYYYLIKLPRLAKKDVNNLWAFKHSKNPFLHCTQHNFLLRVLLIKSKKFKEKDVGLVNIVQWPLSIHQYLVVKIDKKWIDVDVWYAKLGVPFDKHKKTLFRLGKTIF